MILTSKNNPLVKETATLKDKKGRKELGLFLVEGIKMTREALKSGLEVERIFLSETCKEKDFPVEKTVVVSDEVMKHLCDEKTPQGVLCRVKIPVKKTESPKSTCLILDGVADPSNVGAIIRTANASGYKEIYMTPDCADAYAPKSVRASMSGVFFTEIYTISREEIPAVMQGIPVLVADMGGKNVFAYAPPEKFALVIGNEGRGVSTEVRGLATDVIKIPMRETQESLNASVSAGILMYLLKKRDFLE